MPAALYTFGYEGLDINRFIARLREARIQLVIDVRALPLSRKRGFSKSSFREALVADGFDYAHVPALGCPRDIRNRYKLNADWSSYSHDFLSYISTQAAALRELAAQAQRQTACLVCFEADFSRCHRSFVARAAYGAGAPAVQHLTAKTVVLDVALPLAA